MASPYRALFRVPGATRLVLAALVGRLPIGILSIALVLLVKQQTGSYAAAGLVTGAFALGSGGFAPVQGRLVDRLGQGRVLVPLAAVCAAALGGLVAAGAADAPDGLLAVLALVAGATHPPLSACMRSMWSTLIARGDPLLDSAYAFEAIVIEIFFISGPMLTALLVAVASPSAAVVCGAAMLVAGTVLFATAPASRAWRPDGTTVRTRAGALGAPGMRTLVLAILPTGLAFGVLEVAMAAFATRHGSPAAAGLLIAAQALGSLVAGLVYGSRRWPGSLLGRFLALSGGFALSMLPLLLASSIPVMFVFMVVAGVFLAPVTAIIYGLIDRVCPPGTLTEAFNWLIAANVVGTSVGSTVAGVVVQNHGIRAALAIAPAGAALGTLVAIARRRTLQAQH